MILKAACMCQAGSLVWQMSEFWGLYWNSQVKNVSHWEVRLWGALMWCDVFHKLCFPVLTMNSITLLLPVFTKLQTTGKQDLGKGYWTVLRDQWNKDTHPYTQTYTLSRAHTHTQCYANERDCKEIHVVKCIKQCHMCHDHVFQSCSVQRLDSHKIKQYMKSPTIISLNY